MRRVYYSFCIRILTSRTFVHTVLFALGLYGVKVMVHIASVVKNLQSVQVGNLDTFLLNAVLHTHFVTLLSLGVVIYTLISFNYSVFKSPRTRHMQTV